MLSSARVVVMEHSNLHPGMDLLIYLPAVIACVVSFLLDEILEAVIPHVNVQDLLDLVFILTVDDSQGWGRGMLTNRNKVWEWEGQFDNREDWVKTTELGWQGQAVGSMSLTVNGLSHQWDSLDDRQFVAMSLPFSQTLSPGGKDRCRLALMIVVHCVLILSLGKGCLHFLQSLGHEVIDCFQCQPWLLRLKAHVRIPTSLNHERSLSCQ
jgi:hypothetical protein